MKHIIYTLITWSILLQPIHAQVIFTSPEQISTSATGISGSETSTRCQLNSDGNLVVFDSLATNLRPITPSNVNQVYLKNRATQAIELLSSNPLTSLPGDGNSEFANLSDDGRFVVYHSAATNLVTADTNSKIDVFIYDRESPTTIKKVSLGAENISFAQGDNDSYYPDISDNGQRIVFLSLASNLITTDSDVYSDIYLRDTQTDSIVRITNSSTGGSPNGHSFVGSPAISGNGEFVVFGSYASNLIANDLNDSADVFVQEIDTGTREIINIAPSGESFASTDVPIAMGPNSISVDGRYVGFGLDTDFDSLPDKLYLRDRQEQVTILVSKNPAGESANNYADYLQISGDANSILFYSPASNLLATSPNGGTFIFDRDTNEINLIASELSDEPCLSPNGESVAYSLPDNNAFYQVFATSKDRCQEDPLKVIPGVCGCGTSDNDQDLDGTPDCLDLCSSDPEKNAPLLCGCGTPDIDLDLDGTPDCNDQCSTDPGKEAPLTCGCGTADIDTDIDGTFDCFDTCPNDANKITAGLCGCGILDQDQSSDKIPDCFAKNGPASLPAPVITIGKRNLILSLLALQGEKPKFKIIITNIKTKEKIVFITKNINSRIRGLLKGKYKLRYQLVNLKKGTKSKLSLAISFSIERNPKFNVIPNIKGVL